MNNLKVALVHDYLKEYGGAERVVEALHEIFPEAPVYTAYFDPKGLGPHAERLNPPSASRRSGWDIRTSWLQKVPFAGTLLSPFRILAPKIFEGFDLSEYDLVISSCNIYFSKAVKVKPGALHISYIHTPPRYLYGYATSFNYKKSWWKKIGAELANHYLRIVDFETSLRPDILVANSENVRERIKKFYRREAVVVYPPVEVKVVSRPAEGEARRRWQSSAVRQAESRKPKADSYYLSLSRLWKGKGVDIIVEACGKLGLPLKVVGSGPELKHLETLATSYPLRPRSETSKSPATEFLGYVSDEERIKLYSEAKALIVAAEDEDFGITAVEAQAAGTPVIALKSGGYLETVVAGKTGEFFKEGYLEEVLEKFDPKKYKAEDCIKQAENFSQEKFKERILGLIHSHFRS